MVVAKHLMKEGEGLHHKWQGATLLECILQEVKQQVKL
jgi:hypothetical protein